MEREENLTPEYSPSELEELRLKRDIEAIVKRDCRREADYENFKPVPPRKTKRKKIKTKKMKSFNLPPGVLLSDIDGPGMPKCVRCQEEVNVVNDVGLCEECAEEEDDAAC